jgi:hypothetical protein
MTKEGKLEKLNDLLRWAQEDRPTEWRFGQAVFNYAYDVFTYEVEKLRYTKVDCFYDDKKVPDFISALKKEFTNG